MKTKASAEPIVDKDAPSVPGMLTLKENAPASAIVSELAPEPGEPVVRNQVPSAFLGTGLAAWLTQRRVGPL